MGNSVIGELFLTDEQLVIQTLNYLKKTGLASDKLKRNYQCTDKYLFTIEFKENISILSTLESCGYLGKEKHISISNICEDGISFYLVDQYMGDGFLFVPISNINAIHTIDKENLKGLITQEENWK